MHVGGGATAEWDSGIGSSFSISVVVVIGCNGPVAVIAPSCNLLRELPDPLLLLVLLPVAVISVQ